MKQIFYIIVSFIVMSISLNATEHIVKSMAYTLGEVVEPRTSPTPKSAKPTKDTTEIVTLYSASSISNTVEEYDFNYYKISVSEKQILEVVLSHLDNDIDLYVKVGSKPTLDVYDCKSWNSGLDNEKCSLTINTNTDVYMGVYGYMAGNYNIKAILKGGVKKQKFAPIIMDNIMVVVPIK